MRDNVLNNAVLATVGALEEKVKTINEDKFAALKAHIDKQVELPLAYIQIEDNVRRTLDTNSVKFQELVDSIRQQGMLQNLVVELRFEDGQHSLICVAGQRRLLAAREAGKTKANCLIKQFASPAERIAAGLTENLTREDLYCLDIAQGYAGLLANGWTEQQLAQNFERNPRTIRRYRTIAEWPTEIHELIREHQNVFTTKVIFNEFVARRFATLAEFREAVLAKINQTAKTSAARTTVPLQELEINLKAQLQMKLQLKGDEQVGKLTISYQNAEQLQQLKQLLLSQTDTLKAE